MITCICVNTDNVTLLTTLTFKIMSPKILNSRCILIHSWPIHCVPNELCIKKTNNNQTFLTELENNDSRGMLWHCQISSSFNENWTSQRNFAVFLEDFQRNHREFDTEVHGSWMCHPYWLTFHINHKWSLSFIWPQAVSIHWISCRHGKPLYMLFPQHFTNQFEDAIFDARYCQCNSPKFNLFHQRE